MRLRNSLLILTGFSLLFGGFIQVGTTPKHPGATGRSSHAVRLTEAVSDLLGPEEAFARRRGGFGLMRSSRSLWNRKRTPIRRSTPTRVTRPRRTTSTAQRATTPTRRPTSTATGSSRRPVTKRSAMSTRISQDASKRSLSNHKTQQSKFAKQSTSATNTSSYKNNALYNRASESRVPYGRYYNQRDRYYSGSGWSAPGYAFRSYPSFGMWDALIWWSMLDHLSDRRRYSMAHHHASDPGYQEWRREADRMAQENEELKKKLGDLDRQVATMKGLPVDANYLPPGVDPSVALAAEVVGSADPGRPQLVMNTGVENGNYHRFGNILQAGLPEFEIILNNTNGSEENLEDLIKNEADAILVQNDVLNAYLRKNPDAKEKLVGLQASLYTEFVQFLVNEDSGIYKFTDLDPKTHTIYVGPLGSGTHGAWEGFVLQDEKYAEFNTRYASYEEALKQVASEPEAVMLFVGGLNSDLLKRANINFATRINMVPMNEHHFSEAEDQFGNTIYSVGTIPHETYANLQDGWIFGYFGDSSVETLKVEAVLILSQRWLDAYGSRPMSVFEDAVWRSIDEIEKIVGEE